MAVTPACQLDDVTAAPHRYDVPVAKESIFVPEIPSWRTVVWALACSGCGRVTQIPWPTIGASPFGDFKAAPDDDTARNMERARGQAIASV